MKKLLLLVLAFALLLSFASFTVFADEATNEESVEVSEETSEESVELEFLGFGEEGLARNLKYMGLGMLGIFIVIGVVILVTVTLNAVTTKKS